MSEQSSPETTTRAPGSMPLAPDTNALSGPLGLRAGWGLLLFLFLAVAFGLVLTVGMFKATRLGPVYERDAQQARRDAVAARAAHQIPPIEATRLSVTLVSETAQAGAVLLAAWGCSFLEKRRFGVYGTRPRYWLDVVPGAVCGLVAISVLVGLLRALHLLVFDGQLLHGGAAGASGGEWLLAFLMVGVFEEFIFRGYIQFTLTRGLLGLGERVAPRHPRRAAFWITALVWSSLFSATHLANAGEDPFGIFMVFLAGMVFSYALWRTGSLWWAIGFHMTWDWGQSFLFGVPDSGTVAAGRLFATHAVGNPLLSGGRTGPEGSVYVVPVLLLVALVIRMYPQREQPPVEPEGFPLVPHRVAAEPIP